MNQNNNFSFKKVLQPAFIFVGGIVVGIALFAYLPKTKASGPVPDDASLDKFWQVWNLMQTKYPFDDEEPSSSEKVTGAVKGMVASYEDPYSRYFTAEESKLFHEEVAGSFSGIGAEIGERDGILTVISPLEGSPSQKAGVMVGDILLKINETDSLEMTAEQAIKLIRGPEGTTVTLTLGRKGLKEPVVISITRGIISVPTIKAFTKDGVNVIELYQFNDQAYTLVEQELKKAKLNDSSKLVVDLRGNPGGYLESAIKIASLFLSSGEKIVDEKPGRDGEDTLVHRSYGNVIVPEKAKVIVLVDGGSASASEILAGALRDNKRASIMGQTSYGKGSVQEVVDLEDGSSLKVTVAKWFTPKGVSISKNGIKPDIEVIDKDLKDEKDAQLDFAIQYLKKAK